MRECKARQNLHMNVAIAYRENDVLSNVNNLLFAMTHYNCLEMEMRQLKARYNLHMNVAITYRENGVLSNVNSLLFAMTHYNCLEMEMRQLKARQNLHKNVAIAYKENGVLSNVNNLFFAMMHYNCLQTQMHQPRDDGIVEKWTQYVDSAARKCGSKNDRQTQRTTTHNFLCCENGKVLLPNLPATPQELEVLLTTKESSAVKFRDEIRMYNSVLAFTLLDAKVDDSVTGGLGPYSFRI